VCFLSFRLSVRFSSSRPLCFFFLPFPTGNVFRDDGVMGLMALTNIITVVPLSLPSLSFFFLDFRVRPCVITRSLSFERKSRRTERKKERKKERILLSFSLLSLFSLSSFFSLLSSLFLSSLKRAVLLFRAVLLLISFLFTLFHLFHLFASSLFLV